MKSLNIPWLKIRSRWVACVDLLGFRKLISEKHWFNVASIYEQSLEQLIEGPHTSNHVEYVWFSDTFLLYSEDDSLGGFAEIECRVRGFVNGLIMKKIPFRGALSCGLFFAQKQDNIFIGPALVDAYQLCEDQNWIGFVLSPDAVARMRVLGLPPDERLNYSFWPVPRKKNQSHERLLSLLVGGPCIDSRQTYGHDVLVELRDRAQEDSVRTKYDNTLQFLEEAGKFFTVPQ